MDVYDIRVKLSSHLSLSVSNKRAYIVVTASYCGVTLVQFHITPSVCRVLTAMSGESKQPLFRPLGGEPDAEPEVTEIESLCMNCHEDVRKQTFLEPLHACNTTRLYITIVRIQCLGYICCIML